MPSEAQPKLIVNANAVLAKTAPFEWLQTVPLNNGEIVEASRIVQNHQLAKRYPLQARWNSAALARLPESFKMPVVECFNRDASLITYSVNNVKDYYEKICRILLVRPGGCA